MGEILKEFVLRKDPEARRQETVSFLADSGASYSLVPREILTALGIRAHGKVTIELADGTRSERELGGAFFEYQGEGAFSPVLFGEKGEEPLLGVITLEALRLVLNPFKRELYPTRIVRF